MEEQWQDAFFKSTGFGQKDPASVEPSVFSTKEEQKFQDHFNRASQPTSTGLVPGTAASGPGGLAPLPGKIAVGRPVSSIYSKAEPGDQRDGSKPTYEVHQNSWQAPGIGKVQNEYPPQIAVKKEKEGIEEKLMYYKEKLGGADTKKTVSLVFAALSAVCLVLYGFFHEGRYGKVILFVFFLSVIVAVVATLPTSEKSEALLQQEDLPIPVRARHTQDINMFPAPNYPADTVKDRFAQQKTDTKKLEGPRSNVGYYRGDPSPNGLPVLQPSQMMLQDPSHYNMDQATFQEYMRRLNGEAIPQVHQSQPYYPFNAQWEHRSQINDSDTIFGIVDEPSQSLRKSPYREPRMQQAAAKRMHYKDPPPGAVQPLEKTHPWLEKNSNPEPAFLAEVGNVKEKEQASIHNTHDEQQPVNEGPPSNDEESPDVFLSNFLEKKTPSSDTVELAMNEKRT
jgi:hypothetical protein